ncbi:MAG TPA: diadenylate cyclase CdaA [bacterium]|nr:diadenylate cyclase CdaA [bacterium]HOL48676.1 diadenylate cyclase CdaA [bacterium]HPQ19421.1 diadenylate cyclase CdaA [bacterium]
MFNIFSHLSTIDIIDILIVTIIIYKVMIFIKETRASQIMQGFILLLIIAYFADKLQFRIISWFLQKSWQLWVILFIVLFQNEFRQALAKIGEHRIWQVFKTKSNTTDIDLIIKAVLRMSKKNIGAIIAIERNVGLKNYIETGILLNADISIELLTTIFFPNTPLHDGAVIIRENKIIAAGCILPLSEKASLKKLYGTRHRAAVGLSEETDALVIIVSEETGRISIALKGNLSTQLGETELEEFLSIYLK